MERIEIRESLARDRRAVYVGAGVTAVVTLVLFVLPNLLSVAAFKQWYYGLTGSWIGADNPFTPLRLLGGVIGGAVAGWLVSDQGSGALAGAKAALYGLGVAYLGAVAFYMVYFPVVAGVFPPPMFAIVVFPIVYAIPLFAAHAVGGTLAGVVADRLF